MRPRNLIQLLALGELIALAGCDPGSIPTGTAGQDAVAPVRLQETPTVFATDLNSPRGIRFGPDGNLFVAEAGN